MNGIEYLLSNINNINGIGLKTANLLKKKNINSIFDLLWNLPRDFVDRSTIYKINELEIGKIQTLKVLVKKYNFPRVRNLPNRVICEDDTGKIDCVFFNSYEGYIKKILPINHEITIIPEMNHSGYFLIVSDYIKWAKIIIYQLDLEEVQAQVL